MMEKLSRRRFLSRAAATSLSAFSLPLAARAQKTGQPNAKTGGGAAAAAQGASVEELQKIIPDLMKQLRVPGVSVALVRGGKLAWAQGFGVRSVLGKEPVTADTPFESASLSMPPFAYAALKLCEQGQLDLDKPLWDYLPDYFLPADDPASKKITARMILAHTSGLRARPEDKKIRLASAPGAQWSFAVLGFGYLQKIVEKVAGETLEAVMQKNVLRPLGMRASSYEWGDSYERAAASGHDEDGGRAAGKNYYEKFRAFSEEQKARVRTLQPEDAAPSAAYSLTSTPTDYARFLVAVAQPQPKGATYLAESLRAEMFKPQAKVTESVSWGLEWGLERTARGEAFWHWGNAKVLQHFAAGLEDGGAGAVVMTNGANGFQLCKALFPRALGVELSAFNLLLR
jgi:CubicO group peptidase (beta-lactamase class C family)